MDRRDFLKAGLLTIIAGPQLLKAQYGLKELTYTIEINPGTGLAQSTESFQALKDGFKVLNGGVVDGIAPLMESIKDPRTHYFKNLTLEIRGGEPRVKGTLIVRLAASHLETPYTAVWYDSKVQELKKKLADETLEIQSSIEGRIQCKRKQGEFKRNQSEYSNQLSNAFRSEDTFGRTLDIEEWCTPTNENYFLKKFRIIRIKTVFCPKG